MLSRGACEQCTLSSTSSQALPRALAGTQCRQGSICCDQSAKRRCACWRTEKPGWLDRDNKALPMGKQRSNERFKTHPALCTLGRATLLTAPHPAPHSRCATPDHSLQQVRKVSPQRPAAPALDALSCKEGAAAMCGLQDMLYWHRLSHMALGWASASLPWRDLACHQCSAHLCCQASDRELTRQGLAGAHCCTAA